MHERVKHARFRSRADTGRKIHLEDESMTACGKTTAPVSDWTSEPPSAKYTNTRWI